jgi:hypothetical protein
MQLVEEMTIGLSKDDIPFLERENAFPIAALIPGSKAWNEIGEETCKWFSVVRGALQVAHPTQFSELYRHLGLSETSIAQEFSDRESWLWQLVGVTPLKYLEGRWKLSASETLDLFAASKEGRKFIGAIETSAKHHRDPNWARALLDRCDDLAGPLGWLALTEGEDPMDLADVKRQFFSSVVPLLAPKEREIYCERILDQPPNKTPALFHDVFDYLWSPAFTEREVANVARGDEGESAKEVSGRFQAQRRPMLYHSNSSVLPKLPKLIPFKTSKAAAAVEDFSAGLRERDEIRKAFGQET